MSALSGDNRAGFHVMVKPRGPICNLDCAYCYYLSKESLYPGASFRMSDQVLESFTRQYIQAQRVPEVTFAWQGGEPTLMGLDFFRRAVELQKKYRLPGMRVFNALQTNGTRLDDEWCDFFRQHDFLVGLSLDGPRHLHDAYRRDKGGGPTFDRVMAGLSLLMKHCVEFNILACVHTLNAEHPLEVYRFFRDELQARFVQFIPIVERAMPSSYQQGSQVTTRSVTGRQYGDFLITIFDEWVRCDVGQVYIQLFDVALAAWLGRPAGLCVFEPTCGAALALEHNGDLYACDHFVEPRFLLGNLLQTPLVDLVSSPSQVQFGLNKQALLPRYCRQCPVRFVCQGGCPKNRLLETPEGEPGLNALCQGYRAFFTHIDPFMRFMVDELRAGRPPANIMPHLAEQDAEMQRHLASAGRNDPCPCGSGRKFKHCCGRSLRA